MDLSKALLLLLDIFFTLMLFVLVVALGFIIYVSFISELPFYIIAKESSGTTYFESIVGAVLECCSYLFFIGIIYYLRKGIKGMVKEHFFNIDVAKNLNIAGLLLSVVSLITIVVDFLTDLVNGLLIIGTDTLDLNSRIFMIIIGLFLMLMSRVIKEGVALKSENELTI